MIHPRELVIIILLVCLASTCVNGQELTIKRVELENENVFLLYDLQDTTQGRRYTINLYSSRDNFITPLQKITGDIGLEIIPGSNRKIRVNIKEEFGQEFEGKLAFELRARVYIPFIRLESFKKNQQYKRGKPYEIRWSGGRPQNVLNFDLYKGDQRVNTFSGIPNGGKYTILFPMDTRPGSDYHFRISDSKNKDEVVNTNDFRISRKIPLLMKALPAVAVGGVMYFLFQPKEDCEECLPDFPTNFD